MKKLKKIIMKIIKIFIKILSYLNHKLYMKIYNSYLKNIGIKINGNALFIASCVDFDGTDYSLISLGNKVVISKKVIILTHDFSISRGLEYLGYNLDDGELSKVEPVSIGDNTFIGAGTIILPGTSIGNNVIVGAGSVVRGNIPDNSIVIGNPCKIVSKLDVWTQKQIDSNERYKRFIDNKKINKIGG